ncbi:hypothetical protein BD626DRAFT_576409 [Schizophyllum amplum]|uniref:Uncharacterized protein n=1 Tax=Schizophyllum amplum TaxID=97359 RepID=A0A550BTM4_9AGAR|nr:hypothetical protein BD626DRAFT_576409 [Auriculariopsis ampla]
MLHPPQRRPVRRLCQASFPLLIYDCHHPPPVLPPTNGDRRCDDPITHLRMSSVAAYTSSRSSRPPVRRRDHKLRELGDERRLARSDLERAQGKLGIRAWRRRSSSGGRALRSAGSAAQAAGGAATAERADMPRNAEELRRENAQLKEAGRAAAASRRCCAMRAGFASLPAAMEVAPEARDGEKET